MNVLFVHSGSDLYGASRSLLRLASRIAKDGHSAVVVLPSKGPLLVKLAEAGVRVEVMEGLPLLTRRLVTNPLAWARAAAAVPRIARELATLRGDVHADLVHTNTATVLLSSALAAKRGGVPHVWHIREFFGEFRAVWPMYRRAIVNQSARVVCVSEAVAGQFARADRRSKVMVLHNGFPAAEFAGDHTPAATSFRNRFGLDAAPLVGIMGRIKMGRKGQEVLVRAAHLLASRYPAARVLLVGSPFPGNERHLEKIKSLIGNLGLNDRILCTGDVDNVLGALSALDIVILASATPEPFAGAVIEAMALGKAVVGTRTGGTPEQIVDSVTGFLVPPNDPAAMAEAIAKLLDDPARRERMGRAGRKRYLEQFEFETFYGKMMSVYQECLTSR